MGLRERRAAKAFQDNTFPDLKKQIDAAAGFEVDLDVEWTELAQEGSDHLYEECWPKVYFHPVIEAFKGICVDDMGKEALKETLKKVVFKNASDHSSAKSAVTYAEGVLTIDHKPTTNVDDVKDRTKAIQTKLEDAL